MRPHAYSEAEVRVPTPVSPPVPGLAGVVGLPGLAIWRRWPVVGALVFIAGVIAPTFAILLIFQNRDDLVGLFTRPNVLRGLVLVALAGITSRLIAVWLTADRVTEQFAQRRFRVFGSAVVIGLAIPTVLLVVRMEQARTVVQDVFGESEDGGVVSVEPFVDPLAGQFHTVLLMGSDEGEDRLGLRTDTLILAMVHDDTGRTALVSVPRNLTDLQFPPGSVLAERYPNGFDDLINALYVAVENDEDLVAAYSQVEGDPKREAGVQALMEGLSYSLGITIDDYALINSCGFVKVVDAIGGITIDLDKELPMPAMLRCSNYRLTPTIGPGETFMDGTKALGYVRSRLADSDYERMERQRILLQTIADEVGIGDLLLNFGELADAVDDNVLTSMTVEEARTLLATLQDTEQQFESVGLVPPVAEPSDPDYDEIREVLQKIRQSLANGTELILPTSTLGN